MSEADVSGLISYGIKETEAKKIVKNDKLYGRILSAFKASGLSVNEASKEFATDEFGYQQPTKTALIVKLSQMENPNINKVAELIGKGSIYSHEQLTAAMDYLKKNNDISEKELREHSGVGVKLEMKEVIRNVDAVIKNCYGLIVEKGKSAAMGTIIKNVKDYKPHMKFAPSSIISNHIKKALEGLDVEKLKSKVSGSKAEEDEVDPDAIVFKGVVSDFQPAEKNVMGNLENNQKRHMEVTKGQFMTRFPPEPNGWIHIGHAKAMLLDFGLSQVRGGKCYMRFDDTNPAKEKTEFIEGIKKDVRWVGFPIVNDEDDSPFRFRPKRLGRFYAKDEADIARVKKINDAAILECENKIDAMIRNTLDKNTISHTSDYFDLLYHYAIRLILERKAYVCEHDKATVKEQRQKGLPSDYMDRPIIESLREFEKMRIGYYLPNERTLRLKMNYDDPNPNLRDQVAYRIIYRPHPRTGDAWCIYPTYDYSHCVIDSIEQITHSLCTLEFNTRRPSYFWVLDALEIYKPVVWEFSRLNLTHTVMSKRRLQELVYNGYVNGWDDPRMPTIAGMRRRGYTAKGIRDFVMSVGYTTNSGTILHVGSLELKQNKDLDRTSPRLFCVQKPLKVVIKNLKPAECEAPKFPKNKSAGVRKFPITPTIYIEETDFCKEPEDGSYYKRLSLKQPVGLKYANLCIKVVDLKESNGSVTELTCEVVDEKPKGYIHWLPENSPKCELRLYGDLFNSVDLSEYIGDWRDDLNKNSLVVVKDALIEPTVTEYDFFSPENDVDPKRFQFERLGFYVCDPDSKPGALVFNMTMPLTARAPEYTEREKAEMNIQNCDPCSQLDIRVGKIVNIDVHPDSDKLYIEDVDIGNGVIKKVVTGVRKHIPIEKMRNRLVVCFCNIKPSKVAGVDSDAMLFAASSEDKSKIELLDPPSNCPVGTRVMFGNLTVTNPVPVDKKGNLWKSCVDFCTINADGKASYKGQLLHVPQGNITVPSLRNVKFH